MMRIELGTSQARRALHHLAMFSGLKTLFHHSFILLSAGPCCSSSELEEVPWSLQFRYRGRWTRKQTKEWVLHTLISSTKGKHRPWWLQWYRSGNLWGSDIWAEASMAGRSHPVQTCRLSFLSGNCGAKTSRDNTLSIRILRLQWEDRLQTLLSPSELYFMLRASSGSSWSF